ncbi:MAG TPA: hypothetical protein VL049_07900 [Candidatus Dormibacteraeota bacterium]|nr:hypothetical protein [Candidatus Dormibacteraeota bacterium]
MAACTRRPARADGAEVGERQRIRVLEEVAAGTPALVGRQAAAITLGVLPALAIGRAWKTGQAVRDAAAIGIQGCGSPADPVSASTSDARSTASSLRPTRARNRWHYLGHPTQQQQLLGRGLQDLIELLALAAGDDVDHMQVGHECGVGDLD